MCCCYDIYLPSFDILLFTDNRIKKGVQTEMREDAEKLTKNIHEQLEHTSLNDITVVIHIIAATKSMGAKELLIEMVKPYGKNYHT